MHGRKNIKILRKNTCTKLVSFASPCLYSWQILLFTTMSRLALWFTQQPALLPVAIFAELKQPNNKPLLHVRSRLKINRAVLSCSIPLDSAVHRILSPFTLGLRYVPHNLTSLISSFRVRI